MKTVVLLRGINVGGANKLSMRDLKACLEGAGYRDVETYLQSGNVVLSGMAEASVIRGAIKAATGLDVPVLARDALAWQAMVSANPLPSRTGAAGEMLHATLLDGPVDPAELLAGLEKYRAMDELIEVGPGAVYLFCPSGYGRSRLTNTTIERLAACPATTRNWRTVLALVDLIGNETQPGGRHE